MFRVFRAQTGVRNGRGVDHFPIIITIAGAEVALTGPVAGRLVSFVVVYNLQVYIHTVRYFKQCLVVGHTIYGSFHLTQCYLVTSSQNFGSDFA